MIKISHYVKISYPGGGGLEIVNTGPQRIVEYEQHNDIYVLRRHNGNTINVPVSWTLIERIVEDAPDISEEEGNLFCTGRDV